MALKKKATEGEGLTRKIKHQEIWVLACLFKALVDRPLFFKQDDERGYHREFLSLGVSLSQANHLLIANRCVCVAFRE